MSEMNRSRSRSRLIETAFVSRPCNSSEDLDDLDRLANHPALRSGGDRSRRVLGRRSQLRKSRSETGEVLLGSWGSASMVPEEEEEEMLGASVSNQGSPTAEATAAPAASALSNGRRVLGRRAMAMASRFRMSRSATASGSAGK